MSGLRFELQLAASKPVEPPRLEGLNDVTSLKCEYPSCLSDQSCNVLILLHLRQLRN